MAYADILYLAKIAVESIAVIMILYGALLAMYRIIAIERSHKKQRRFTGYEHAKRIFLQKLIFALDFFVVSTLFDLAIAVSLSDIVRVATIVAIRTILSLSVHAELHEENNH